MAKLSITDLKDFRGKTVFVRVDYNVPLDDAGNITDDKRIKATVPTLDYRIKGGAKVVLASHLGRPKGKRDPAEPQALRRSVGQAHQPACRVRGRLHRRGR